MLVLVGADALAQNGRWRTPDSTNHPLLAKKRESSQQTNGVSSQASATSASLSGFISTGGERVAKQPTQGSSRPAVKSSYERTRLSKPTATHHGVRQAAVTAPVSPRATVSNAIQRAVFTPSLQSKDPFKNPFARVSFQQPSDDGFVPRGGSTTTQEAPQEQSVLRPSDGGSENGSHFSIGDRVQVTPQPTVGQRPNLAPPASLSHQDEDAAPIQQQTTPQPVNQAPLSIGSPQTQVTPVEATAPVADTNPPQQKQFQPIAAGSLNKSPDYNNRDCKEDGKECSVARKLLDKYPIRSISLNVSPILFKARKEEDQAEKEAFRKANIKQRKWHDRGGELLAEGRLVDFRYERVHLETANGDVVKVPVRDLGEDDLCYLAAWWEVPTQCLLPIRGDIERSPTPLTMSWKASAVCAKPNYFENVQLERYGHTAGPILQPLLSSAHFVGSIATLPYQAGIHPPGECVYPLGYYRPGDCAPWLVPPVPLSVRGGLLQAGAVTGAAVIIP